MGSLADFVESTYTRSLLEEQIFGLQFDGDGITLFNRYVGSLEGNTQSRKQNCIWTLCMDE